MKEIVGDNVKPQRHIVQARTEAIDDFLRIRFAERLGVQIVVVTCPLALLEWDKFQSRS